MLALKNVSYKAGSQTLVHNATVQFAPGSITAIIGPNGAGKSTLLKLASGLIPAASGHVLLDGKPLATFPAKALAGRRAMLLQHSPLDAQFNVLQLVNLGASISATRLPAPARAELAQKMLARVGLQSLAHRSVMALSGGERQRAHLARVLMQLEASTLDGQPGFLLLDEPISAQDPAQQRLILQIATAHARRGGSVVVVLHDLNWASACADHIVVMHNGCIHSQGSPETILTPNMVSTVFRLTQGCFQLHTQSGKPYILPHDILS